MFHKEIFNFHFLFFFIPGFRLLQTTGIREDPNNFNHALQTRLWLPPGFFSCLSSKLLFVITYVLSFSLRTP